MKTHFTSRFLLLVGAIGIFGLSYGQDSKFSFGLKGAANLGWINANSKTIENNGLAMGFSYGIMGDFHFTENYSLSAEFLISNVQGNMLYKGETGKVQFKEDSTNTPISNLNYKLSLQYIQIPISMKFRTKEIGYITYWAQFGVAPGFLIGTKADLSGDIPATIEELDPTAINLNKEEGDLFNVDGFEDQVFPVRLGLIIGGGIEYKLAGSTSLYTGIRLNNSFTDLFVKDDNVAAQNSFISINAGLFF